MADESISGIAGLEIGESGASGRSANGTRGEFAAGAAEAESNRPDNSESSRRRTMLSRSLIGATAGDAAGEPNAGAETSSSGDFAAVDPCADESMVGGNLWAAIAGSPEPALALFASLVFEATIGPPFATTLADESAVEELPPSCDPTASADFVSEAGVRFVCLVGGPMFTDVAERRIGGGPESRLEPTRTARIPTTTAANTPSGNSQGKCRTQRGDSLGTAASRWTALGRRHFQPVSGGNRKQIGHQIIWQLITICGDFGQELFQHSRAVRRACRAEVAARRRFVGLMLQELLQHGAVGKRRSAREQ